MKNIIIIEDEQIAAQNLQRQLSIVAPDLQVVATLQTIEESVEFFQEKPAPDLCFMDIHLADGLAFHIFEKVKVNCPIIFTTAYDQYALAAFKVNSIDYILKPINKVDLQRALDKAKYFTRSAENSKIEALVEMFQKQNRQYKECLLIPIRDKLIPLQVDEIACIFIENKLTHIITYKEETFFIDKPLDTITDWLNPAHFFRANRQYIIGHRAIKDITLWPLGKLSVNLCVKTPERIIISKTRVHQFKDWYTR